MSDPAETSETPTTSAVAHTQQPEESNIGENEKEKEPELESDADTIVENHATQEPTKVDAKDEAKNGADADIDTKTNVDAITKNNDGESTAKAKTKKSKAKTKKSKAESTADDAATTEKKNDSKKKKNAKADVKADAKARANARIEAALKRQKEEEEKAFVPDEESFVAFLTEVAADAIHSESPEEFLGDASSVHTYACFALKNVFLRERKLDENELGGNESVSSNSDSDSDSASSSTNRKRKKQKKQKQQQQQQQKEASRKRKYIDSDDDEDDDDSESELEKPKAKRSRVSSDQVDIYALANHLTAFIRTKEVRKEFAQNSKALLKAISEDDRNGVVEIWAHVLLSLFALRIKELSKSASSTELHIPGSAMFCAYSRVWLREIREFKDLRKLATIEIKHSAKIPLDLVSENEPEVLATPPSTPLSPSPSLDRAKAAKARRRQKEKENEREKKKKNKTKKRLRRSKEDDSDISDDEEDEVEEEEEEEEEEMEDSDKDEVEVVRVKKNKNKKKKKTTKDTSDAPKPVTLKYSVYDCVHTLGIGNINATKMDQILKRAESICIGEFKKQRGGKAVPEKNKVNPSRGKFLFEDESMVKKCVTQAMCEWINKNSSSSNVHSDEMDEIEQALAFDKENNAANANSPHENCTPSTKKQVSINNNNNNSNGNYKPHPLANQQTLFPPVIKPLQPHQQQQQHQQQSLPPPQPPMQAQQLQQQLQQLQQQIMQLQQYPFQQHQQQQQPYQSRQNYWQPQAQPQTQGGFPPSSSSFPNQVKITWLIKEMFPTFSSQVIQDIAKETGMRMRQQDPNWRTRMRDERGSYVYFKEDEALLRSVISNIAAPKNTSTMMPTQNILYNTT